MWPMLRDLVYDRNSFANFFRVLVFALGEMLSTFGPDSKYFWAGKVVQALSLVIRAGDKNTPASKAVDAVVESMSSAEIKPSKVDVVVPAGTMTVTLPRS